jgi:DNA-binding NtrC family response regulator
MTAAQEGDQNRGGATGQTRKMLLVDDEAEVLSTSAETLRSLGYEVLCAATAQEALQALTDGSDIEVMLADVLMPGTNGVELAREARRLQPSLDVILVSGFPTTAMDASAGEPGEFKFLMKPFSPSEVALLLRSG